MSITITSVKDAKKQVVASGSSNSGLAFPLTVEGTAAKHHAIVLLVNDKFLDVAVSVESGAWLQQINEADVKKGAPVKIAVAQADVRNTSAKFELSL